MRGLRRGSALRAGTWALGVAVVASYAAPARAGGLYFSDRGVRPLGRGGAFVAGADDLGAIWYNPAGIVDAGSSVLVDAAWLNFTSDYTNQTQVIDASGTVTTVTAPTTHGSTPFLPIPTIVGGWAVNDKLELAIGAFAPYTAIASYPEDAASRYSLVSLNGSALVITGIWAAYKPVEWLRFGAGFEALVGTFSSSVVFNANPADRLVGAPEAPQYDALSQLNVGPIFAPSGNAGLTIVPDPHVRIGLSGQLPFVISAPASINVRLPSSPLFDSAAQDGNDATVKFTLPGILRAGVEVRPITALRVELTYVRELWSEQQSIQIIPSNVYIDGVTGFPQHFKVSPITIPRNYMDSSSVRLGGEISFVIGGYQEDIRAGISYDESAVPSAYLAPLTVDLNKITPSIGGSLHIGKNWRFDVFGFSTTVNPAIASVPLINPVQGNPTQTQAINGGTYSARADVLGVGLNYKF